MATATTKRSGLTSLEKLCDFAEQVNVELDGVEFCDAEKAIRITGTGTRKMFNRYLDRVVKHFTIVEHRIAFDLLAARPRLYVVVKLGTGPDNKDRSERDL